MISLFQVKAGRRCCENTYNQTRGSLRTNFNRFKLGWVPHQDAGWLNRFKVNTNGNDTSGSGDASTANVANS